MLIKLTDVDYGTIAVGAEHILSVIPECVNRSEVMMPGVTYTVKETVDQVFALASAKNEDEGWSRTEYFKKYSELQAAQKELVDRLQEEIRALRERIEAKE